MDEKTFIFGSIINSGILLSIIDEIRKLSPFRKDFLMRNRIMIMEVAYQLVNALPTNVFLLYMGRSRIRLRVYEMGSCCHLISPLGY